MSINTAECVAEGASDDYPLVSVVVPVYNVQRYLAQCLDSIVTQDYGALDVVVVDDGSTDRCAEICDAYAAGDKRVRVFHTPNKGVSAARNLGVERARGSYLLFVDADDWIEPNTVRTMVHTALGTDSDMVSCSRWVEWGDGTSEPEVCQRKACVVLNNNQILRMYMQSGLLRSVVWGKLCHTKLFDSALFPEGHVYEDSIAVPRLCMTAKRVACIADPLFHYRMRRGSIMHRQSAKSIVDRWWAWKQRVSDLGTMAGEYHNLLVADGVYVVWYVWRWWITCSKSERLEHVDAIKEMRDFCRSHVREVLQGGYSRRTKFTCLLGVLDSPLVWAPAHIINKVYLTKHERHELWE